MAWLRIDDGFPEHKKLLSLQRNERWTWIEILAYCARQSNGGVLPDGIEKHMKYVSTGYLDKCVAAGLLDVVNGLYTVHDWDEYNPRDPTNAVRQARYRNAKRNDEVTPKVTEATVTNVTPPARAARPVPSPTNKEPAPAPEPVANKDEPDGAGAGQKIDEPNFPQPLRVSQEIVHQLEAARLKAKAKR